MYRAVVNGKKTVRHADALADLVSAANDQQRMIAVSEVALDEQRNRTVQRWRKDVVEVLAVVEAGLDFEEVLVGWG